MIANLYFYHHEIELYSENENVCTRIKRDFSYFLERRTSSQKKIKIELYQKEPDFSLIKGWYFFCHFKGTVYGWGDLRWVKYDETLVFFDAKNNYGQVVSCNEELLYHYTYYMIISKIGEFLDTCGLHRFHSLGISLSEKATLFSMPISGGKTTLGLELMKDEEISLYSEDTPLIDKDGKVSPFAVRLSIRPGNNNIIPEKWKRIKNDPIFGVKILVDLEFYGLKRIENKKQPAAFIFWGLKSEKLQPKVKKMSFFRSLFLLLYFIVIGKDCPQRSELFLRVSSRGLFTIITIFCKRFRAAYALSRQSQSYYFYMTTDIEKNASFIKKFVTETK